MEDDEERDFYFYAAQNSFSSNQQNLSRPNNPNSPFNNHNNVYNYSTNKQNRRNDANSHQNFSNRNNFNEETAPQLDYFERMVIDFKNRLSLPARTFLQEWKYIQDYSAKNKLSFWYLKKEMIRLIISFFFF